MSARHPSGCPGLFPRRQSPGPSSLRMQFVSFTFCMFQLNTSSHWMQAAFFSQRSQTEPMLFRGKLHVHRVLIMLYLKWIPFKSRQRGCNNNDQNHRRSGKKKGISALSERPKNIHASLVCPTASMKNTAPPPPPQMIPMQADLGLISCWLYDVSIYLMQVLSSRTNIRSVFLSQSLKTL